MAGGDCLVLSNRSGVSSEKYGQNGKNLAKLVEKKKEEIFPRVGTKGSGGQGE